VSDFRPHPVPCLLIQDSKSGKQRAIYLNDEAAAFFAGLCRGRPAWEAIFLRSDGATWQPAQHCRRMVEACQRAGIDRPFSFHGLRHTYASLYLMNGGQLPDLAAQLGHADTRMTIRHYAHLADSWRADSARKFAPTFGAVDAAGVLRFRPRDEGGDHAGHL
jgi:integrase